MNPGTAEITQMPPSGIYDDMMWVGDKPRYNMEDEEDVNGLIEMSPLNPKKSDDLILDLNGVFTEEEIARRFASFESWCKLLEIDITISRQVRKRAKIRYDKAMKKLAKELVKRNKETSGWFNTKVKREKTPVEEMITDEMERYAGEMFAPYD